MILQCWRFNLSHGQVEGAGTLCRPWAGPDNLDELEGAWRELAGFV
jgi:hypothetical protein